MLKIAKSFSLKMLKIAKSFSPEMLKIAKFGISAKKRICTFFAQYFRRGSVI